LNAAFRRLAKLSTRFTCPCQKHTAIMQTPPLQMGTYDTYYRCRTATLPVKLPSVRLNSVVYFYCHPRCELLPKGSILAFPPPHSVSLKKCIIWFLSFARSSASGSVKSLPNDQTKQHGSQHLGGADGDLIKRCLRPKAMRRRVPLRVHDWANRGRDERHFRIGGGPSPTNVV
jgi:hypothetical protein